MTLVPMAAIARRQSRRLEALRYLDSAIAAYPNIPYVRATRALLRIQLGDIRGARQDADAAVAIKSTYRTPQLSALSRVLWIEGDTARALATLDEAEHSLLHAGSPSPSDAFWICLAEFTAGRIDKAKSLFVNAKPRGALLWFMFQGEELAEFRKYPEIARIMSRIDPRAQVR
jgi:tetratricopeptide (TPR) repeat protein